MSGRDQASDGGDVGIDILVGLILIAISLLALFWLIPVHTEGVSSQNDLPPAFFPSAAATVVLVLATALIGHRLIRRPDVPRTLPGSQILLEIGIWSTIALFAVLALPVIGFLPVSALLILAGGWAAHYRRWRVLVPLAILFPAVVDFSAWQIFTVALP